MDQGGRASWLARKETAQSGFAGWRLPASAFKTSGGPCFVQTAAKANILKVRAFYFLTIFCPQKPGTSSCRVNVRATTHPTGP